MDQAAQQRVRATIVGSLPKPGWLAKPGELFPPWRLEGAILEEGKEDAVRLWVAAQEQAGLDTVTDGEQRRRHRHRQPRHAGAARSTLSQRDHRRTIDW
jgi:methionine synthase II (cobalamin-independent)